MRTIFSVITSGYSFPDMDVVYDNYEPVTNSFFDNLFGFFLGVRQQGLQTTEEVLRDGSFITAVGELELSGGQLRLQPSAAGPMMLTMATKNTILRRLSDAKASSMVRIILFGSVGVLLTAYIVRRMYAKRRKRLEEQRTREMLERSRKERREAARGGNGRQQQQQRGRQDEQVCVVCRENPKEVGFFVGGAGKHCSAALKIYFSVFDPQIICLPCGHVCLCETCATHIDDRCPVCRTTIDMKAAAFIT